MKITNRNRNKPPVKKQDFHRIAIWNKANSNLQSSLRGFPIIRQSILRAKANMIIFSEAYLVEENRKFPDYDTRRKLITGFKTSRIAVLIKNQGVNIQRVTNIEDPSTACIWFKIQLANKVVFSLIS